MGTHRVRHYRFQNMHREESQVDFQDASKIKLVSFPPLKQLQQADSAGFQPTLKVQSGKACSGSFSNHPNMHVTERSRQTCVWMGLKCVMPLNRNDPIAPASVSMAESSADAYRASKAACRRAVTGRGWRSRSSVGGGNFSGRMRWRKETGSMVWELSQRSETTLMKY